MSRNPTRPRSAAHLTAFNGVGGTVLVLDTPLAAFYEQSHDVIDSVKYRCDHGIIRVTGKLFNDAGEMVEEFENNYCNDGTYLGSTTRHSDGSITGG